ncbi:MAG TPA: methyltransferase domain-containing protein [Tepidisphaeraceae bacterium]|jgi:SAM-dependent methyltransferase|nr:methyltransferase domain-containing protein [Tepidisphaeraceae bacterium]
MHPNSRLLFDRYARSYFKPARRVLEIGPDAHPSTHCRDINDNSILWETCDIFEDSRLTYRMLDEYTLPIGDEQYDIVLASNVLEHVRKPWVWMKELARVCKTGGYVVTVNPVSWPFHEAPYDCWRAYPEGMKALYEDAGLVTLVSKFESLEIPGFRRYIPGQSWYWLHWRRRLAFRLLAPIGFPLERAYDTVSVGQKTNAV